MEEGRTSTNNQLPVDRQLNDFTELFRRSCLFCRSGSFGFIKPFFQPRFVAGSVIGMNNTLAGGFVESAGGGFDIFCGSL